MADAEVEAACNAGGVDDAFVADELPKTMSGLFPLSNADAIIGFLSASLILELLTWL